MEQRRIWEYIQRPTTLRLENENVVARNNIRRQK